MDIHFFLFLPNENNIGFFLSKVLLSPQTSCIFFIFHFLWSTRTLTKLWMSMSDWTTIRLTRTIFGTLALTALISSIRYTQIQWCSSGIEVWIVMQINTYSTVLFASPHWSIGQGGSDLMRADHSAIISQILFMILSMRKSFSRGMFPVAMSAQIVLFCA